MASSISATVASTARTTVDQPDSLVITIDLPLAPGAAPYRSEASGQLVLSHTLYGGDNNIGIVVIGGWPKKLGAATDSNQGSGGGAPTVALLRVEGGYHPQRSVLTPA
jgi:hypothetical protein